VGWAKVAVSAAERSWDGKRVRKFDADEIVAIATVLGVPVSAQEQHRQAMGSLVQQREELERRVDDLRAFEREYRSRFMA
jgi:hypothetical protein